MKLSTISIILIATVVACPLLCGNGVCHASHACPVESCCLDEPALEMCLRHGTVGCACESTSRDHAPCQCPNKEVCQGVCGGAVLEKARELDCIENSSILPLVDRDAIGAVFAKYREGHAEPLCGGGSVKSVGRFMRTLYASFLC